MSQGKTLDELKENLKDALTLFLYNRLCKNICKQLDIPSV